MTASTSAIAAPPPRLAGLILHAALKQAWLLIALAALPVLVALYAAPPATDRPIPDGPLKAAAAPMLARAGVAGTPIVTLPKGACAWGTVAGLGRREEIVITPGTLAYPLPEALWTVGHEAGHVRRGDPLLGVLVGWAWIALALGAAQAAAVWGWKRWRWPGLLALPVALGLVWAAGLPVFNLVQRQVERRADRFGVEVAGSGAAAAAMLARSDACMGAHDPPRGAFTTLFRLNHDRSADRIAMLKAMDGPSAP